MLAEFLGTAGLLAIVVGSGIMAAELSQGNLGVALLANGLATAGGLIALILTFGHISGAHFNPVISIMSAVHGSLSWGALFRYLPAQIAGSIAGVMLAHGMFDKPLIQWTGQARHGVGIWLSEVVATAGLCLVVYVCARKHPKFVPFAVAGFVFAGYWFTASTCFANPAVTIARCFTGTFAGIAPNDVLGFIICQGLGLAVALALIWLLTEESVQTPPRAPRDPNDSLS